MCMYKILYVFVWVIAWLPLSVLYLFSDFCYYIIYYLVGYRKKVVAENLRLAFPERNEKERLAIQKRFYRFFCDVFVETISEMHMSRNEMRKRMNFVNVEQVLQQYEKGKSCMLMTAHYGNWEWASTLSVWLPEGKPLYGIYKRLTNKNFDHLMCELRMRFTGKNVEKNDLARKMLQLKIDKQLAMFGMISDQTPLPSNAHTWVHFLNQDTITTVGTELLAKKFDYPVFYGKITCTKRGYYDCEFIPISLSPKDTGEGEITAKYMSHLEQTIIDAPAFWLWSHKRWKFNRGNSPVPQY
jgi:Kdo2-lipid IVA lauroyltransferase/acyltransferase